jgi:hypothetical protein
MLDTDTKRRIDTASGILVGKAGGRAGNDVKTLDFETSGLYSRRLRLECAEIT